MTDVSQGVSELLDLVNSQRKTITTLEAQVAEYQKGQTYRYIGKDGKSILARDLEDDRDNLRAHVAAADRLADVVFRLLGQRGVDDLVSPRLLNLARIELAAYRAAKGE